MLPSCNVIHVQCLGHCQVYLPKGMQLCDGSKELEVVLRLAKRAEYFGLRSSTSREVKKETMFLLCSLAQRHPLLTTLAANGLRYNWSWFHVHFDFEAWLCASWVGWEEGKREVANTMSANVKQTHIPPKGCPFYVLNNIFVNGPLQSEVLTKLGLPAHHDPHEWWRALDDVLNERFPDDPKAFPLCFRKDGSLAATSVNRAYFLTHVVMLICSYGQVAPLSIVRLSKSTMLLLKSTIECYWEQTSAYVDKNEEVHWELCSALQCLEVDRHEIRRTQAELTSRFENVAIEPSAVSLGSMYTEMHYHFLAGVLVAGPARVITNYM